MGVKEVRHVLAAVSAAAVVLLTNIPALAVTQAEIDEWRDVANSIADEKDALNAEIAALSDGIAVNLQKKELLDGEIGLLEEEIDAIQAEIDACGELIAQTEAELDDARAREEAKYDLFCQRVRVMEGQGPLNFWSVLFHASSFADLLTRMDLYHEIMLSDQQVMDDLRALQEEIAVKEAELETQKASHEAAQSELDEKRSELDVEREAANQVIMDLQNSMDEAEAGMMDLEAAEEEVLQEILRLSEQYAQEEAARYRAAGLDVSYDLYEYSLTDAAALGGYAWPVDSRRINSPFGYRSSPGGIGSTNHKGVDIGGVGYGTAVHAAKAGVVIVSQYHPSYGNYVVVSHGAGNTTLYAHMSRRTADVGQYVVQGDVLGLTGSTGQSTGPHLHFEITENGVRINPLIYLNGYYMA